jgi:hypothetical protein
MLKNTLAMMVVVALASSVSMADDLWYATIDSDASVGTVTTAGVATGIGLLDVGLWKSLAYDDATDSLYMTTNAGQLYGVNTTTGATTVIGSETAATNLDHRASGMAFDYDNNILYGGKYGGEVWSINTTDGTRSARTDVNGSVLRVDSMAYANGKLYLGENGGVDNAGGEIHLWDPSTPTVAATPFAVVNADGLLRGLAYDRGTNLIYAIVEEPGSYDQLYSIALDGTVTSIAGLNGTVRTEGMAPTFIPEPATLALLAIGGLMMTVRRRHHGA